MPSTCYDIRPTKATFGECRNTIMPHKSKSRWLRALILRFSALLACAVTGGTVDVKVFKATKGPVQNVVVLNYSDTQDPIIVGGRNAVYMLSSANFSLEAIESTGPEKDSVKCPPDPLDCDHSRAETDNDNRVLLQIASNPLVLACGTTSQGMCAMHEPLRQLRVNIPMDKRPHVNYVASKESTVAFFGTGKYQTKLFVGSTYDSRPLPYHPFAVSARIFANKETFALHEHTKTTASFVNVYKDFKTSYLIRYVYGFSYNGFAYFVTVQNKGAALDLFETRLVRVCEGDVSFLTYMEVPIECPKDAGMRFTIATSASFGPPSNWAGSGLGSGSKMLAVAFGSPVDGRRDKNDPNLGSVVCFFDMASVEEAFRETVVNCNEGKDRANLSRLFHGSHADLKCTAIDLRGDALCSPGPNSYIEGLLPLFGRATIRLWERLATSVTLMEQNNIAVIWVGDHKGFLYKYSLRGDSPNLLFSKDLSNGEGVTIDKSTAVDRKGTYGYFLMGDRVIRFPVGSCSIYDRCSQCMRRSDEDPLKCGWCGDQCSHFAECKDDRLFQTANCPIYLESVSPAWGPPTGGTLLTFKGENFGTPEHYGASNIEITVGDHSCDLIHWNFTIVQCKTPVGQQGSKVDIVISVTDTHWDEVKKYDILDSRTIDGGFEYEVATFTGVQPSYGPMAGGTNITLHGANLNIGLQQVVKVGENLCYIFRVERTSLECSTSAVAIDNVDQESSVALYIDEVQVPFISADNLGSKFTYKPNPVIESIFPDTATFSGDSAVEVRGAHLDSVAKPTMVTDVTALNHKRSERITTDCSPAEGGQKMLCPVKPLTESSVLDTTKLEEYQLPIPVRVSFRMDGLRLPAGPSGEGGHFTFVYRPPPQFERFPDSGLDVSLKNPIVQITGKHFDVLKGSNRVFIRVDGKDNVCNITIGTTITCVLVTSALDENSPHYLVVVYAGEAHPLGALNLVAEESGVNTGIIAGVMVAIFFTALAVVGFLFYRRQQAKKAQPPGYFVDFDSRHVENGLRGGGANSYVAGSENDARQALIGSSFQLDEETRAMLEAENLLFKREFLVLGPVIGQGHFGCVYRGTLELEGKGEVQAVAVKTLHNNSRGGEADSQAFLEEALIMKDFHHMNVLPLIGLSIDEGGDLMVIIPYMKYGDLLSYIRDDRNNPTVEDLITYGIHVAEGMKYLTDTKFVHRDLAARNCMLSEDYIVRVADFGLSRDVYEKDYYSEDNTKTKLPVKWMSPESLEKGIYNHKTDVWSYGVLLWELMTRGVTPYPEVDNWDIVNFLKHGHRMQQPSFCPDELYDIMLQCWQEDPKKRPSFANIVTDVANVITRLEKWKRNKRVSLKVTYVNCPRNDRADGAGPSRERYPNESES